MGNVQNAQNPSAAIPLIRRFLLPGPRKILII
jgi:hypothetical protein